MLQRKDELIEELTNQLGKIEKFAALYDNGELNYAQDIAAKLRLLLHTKGQSESIIHQLQIEKKIAIYDTGTVQNRNLPIGFEIGKISTPILCIMDFSGKWFPKVKIFRTQSFLKIPFENWWEQVIITDKFDNKFSRKSIILHLAETDGGVHLDRKLKADYKELSRLNSINITRNLQDGNGVQPVDNPVPASIRQIAEEVLQTFKELISDDSKSSINL